MIIRPPKRAFYPRFAKIVNDFARQLQMSGAHLAASRLVLHCCLLATRSWHRAARADRSRADVIIRLSGPRTTDNRHRVVTWFASAPETRTRPSGRSWRFERKHVNDAAHAIFRSARDKSRNMYPPDQTCAPKRPMSERTSELQSVSLGEQNCPSVIQGASLVTLSPLLTQVHRTVSPATILISSLVRTNPWPTLTS